MDLVDGCSLACATARQAKAKADEHAAEQAAKAAAEAERDRALLTHHCFSMQVCGPGAVLARHRAQARGAAACPCGTRAGAVAANG